MCGFSSRASEALKRRAQIIPSTCAGPDIRPTFRATPPPRPCLSRPSSRRFIGAAKPSSFESGDCAHGPPRREACRLRGDAVEASRPPPELLAGRVSCHRRYGASARRAKACARRAPPVLLAPPPPARCPSSRPTRRQGVVRFLDLPLICGRDPAITKKMAASINEDLGGLHGPHGLRVRRLRPLETRRPRISSAPARHPLHPGVTRLPARCARSPTADRVRAGRLARSLRLLARTGCHGPSP